MCDFCRFKGEPCLPRLRKKPTKSTDSSKSSGDLYKRVGIPFSTGDRVSADNTADSPRSEEEAGVEEDLEDESPDMRPGSGLKRGFMIARRVDESDGCLREAR